MHERTIAAITPRPDPTGTYPEPRTEPIRRVPRRRALPRARARQGAGHPGAAGRAGAGADARRDRQGDGAQPERDLPHARAARRAPVRRALGRGRPRHAEPEALRADAAPPAAGAPGLAGRAGDGRVHEGGRAVLPPRRVRPRQRDHRRPGGEPGVLGPVDPCRRACQPAGQRLGADAAGLPGPRRPRRHARRARTARRRDAPPGRTRTRGHARAAAGAGPLAVRQPPDLRRDRHLAAGAGARRCRAGSADLPLHAPHRPPPGAGPGRHPRAAGARRRRCRCAEQGGAQRDE